MILNQFITTSDTVDLWLLNPKRDRFMDWMCKARRDNVEGGSIIDCVVVSRRLFMEDQVRKLDARNLHWIPATDHTPILASFTLHINGAKACFNSPKLVKPPTPQICYPCQTDKGKHETFRSGIDEMV